MSDISSAVEFKRRPEENERQYIWRICSAKDSGLLDASWEQVTAILNEELHGDSELSYSESVYRKSYRAAKAYYDDVFKNMQSSSAVLKKMEEEKSKIETATKQYRDQRREYQKLLTYKAREENLHQALIEAAKDMEALLNPEIIPKESIRASEAVLFLNDWHYGMKTDNIWNTYNVQKCIDRAGELVEKTIAYLIRHDVKVLHIALLGDACAGAIHVGTRVESEEVVCDQLMHVSELIAEVIARLSEYVEEVKVYSTYGNHCRTVQNKNDSLHRDNMERVIPWWLKARFDEDWMNIEIIEQEEYGEFIHIPVCGQNLIAAHGDLDRIRNMGLNFYTLFAQKHNLKVDYVVVGDKHHFENIERLGVDAMIVPAMCGTDEYAHTKRLYSDPAQVLMMFTPEEGRECVYTIKFSS